MKQCSECGDVVVPSEITSNFGDIVAKIEQGAEEVTDLEEAIYFNAYCAKCASRFLVDESRSQVYNDQ